MHKITQYRIVNNKCRADFKDYIDGLLMKIASKKSVDKIMQKENDLYEHDEEDGDEQIINNNLHGKSCRQTISRITNTSKRGNI